MNLLLNFSMKWLCIMNLLIIPRVRTMSASVTWNSIQEICSGNLSNPDISPMKNSFSLQTSPHMKSWLYLLKYTSTFIFLEWSLMLNVFMNLFLWTFRLWVFYMRVACCSIMTSQRYKWGTFTLYTQDGYVEWWHKSSLCAKSILLSEMG